MLNQPQLKDVHHKINLLCCNIHCRKLTKQISVSRNMAFNVMFWGIMWTKCRTTWSVIEHQHQWNTETLVAADLTQFSCVQVSKDQRVRRVCNDVSVVALNSHFINFVAVERLKHYSHARWEVLHNHLQQTASTGLLSVSHSGHQFKLMVQRNRTNTRSSFFSQRVVNIWNGIPRSVVSATSTNNFKNRLDDCAEWGI